MTTRSFVLVSSIALVLCLTAAPGFAQDSQPVAQTEEQPALVPVDVFQGAGILIAKTSDDAFKWWLDGRIMIDAAGYTNSVNPLSNGAEIRRTRFGLNMVLYKNWAAQFDVDFADNAVEMKDQWIAYTGFKNSLIRVGNFKEPFGLETLISSRYISFIERPLSDNFSPDRHIGATYSRWADRWQATGGAFVQTPGSPDTTGQDQAYGFTGRVTALPYSEGRSFVHVGLAGSYQKPNAATSADLSDANQMRLRARPETHVNRGRFVDTKKVSNVDHANLMDVELAGEFNRLTFQSEYVRDTFQRTVSTLVAPTFYSWYAHAAFFLTRDHRPYDHTAGEFDRVIPSGPRGAVEVLARYSMINLNSPGAGILGGRESITTVGLNWYINGNVRLMTDFSTVRNDGNTKGDRAYIPGDTFNELQARFQLNF